MVLPRFDSPASNYQSSPFVVCLVSSNDFIQMKLIPIGSNQNMITTNKGDQVLFSYQTPVAAYVDGDYIRTSTKWSSTTSRHINKWLEGVKAKEVDQTILDALVDS